MSGSAALSAARKRRASNSQMASNGSQSYYNRGQGSIPVPIPVPVPGPGPLAPGSSFGNEPSKFVQQYPNQIIPNGFPPQPMNIYENIELIKQQLAERTKLIQTQGSSIPPEKLKILHKQNEIQTQILKQKIAISKQMESMNQTQDIYGNKVIQPNASIPSIPEPEFVYERGIPKRNPNYKTINQTAPISNVVTQNLNSGTLNITPFVTMISDTGVIPPPIVIIKAHDEKLQEHNRVLNEIVQHVTDLQIKVNKHGVSNSNIDPQQKHQHSTNSSSTSPLEDIEEDEEDEPEEELLMDVVMNDLTNSREFVEGIVNKIVNETNLSEVIMKIEPLVKENQELRSLIHSQQQMMNEMNTMLLRLLNQNNTSVKQESYQDNGLDSDGLYEPEMTEIILSTSDTHKLEPVLDEGSPNKSTFSLSEINTIQDMSSDVSVNLNEDNNNEHDCNGHDHGNGDEHGNGDDHGHEHGHEHGDEDMNDRNESNDDHSSPHFPNVPISLVINEIQE